MLKVRHTNGMRSRMPNLRMNHSASRRNAMTVMPTHHHIHQSSRSLATSASFSPSVRHASPLLLRSSPAARPALAMSRATSSFFITKRSVHLQKYNFLLKRNNNINNNLISSTNFHQSTKKITTLTTPHQKHTNQFGVFASSFQPPKAFLQLRTFATEIIYKKNPSSEPAEPKKLTTLFQDGKRQLTMDDLPKKGLFGIGTYKYCSKFLHYLKKPKVVYFLMDREGWVDIDDLFDLYPAQFRNRAPARAKGIWQDSKMLVFLMKSHYVNQKSLATLFELKEENGRNKIRPRGQLWDSVKMWHRLKFGQLNKQNSFPNFPVEEIDQ